MALALQACGGGGSGDSGTSPTTPTTPTTPVTAAVSGVAGSTCSFEYLPQARVYDLDYAAYTTWANGRVTCKATGVSDFTIAGLSASAFKFSTAAGAALPDAEAVETGTSSIDGATTYLIRLHRDASSTAETMTVNGTDSAGRTVKFTAALNFSGGNAVKLADLSGGGSAAVNRIIDTDGMGYKATYFVFAPAAVSPSTSACPSVTSNDHVEKTFTGTNSRNQAVDARYCFYTNMTISNFFTHYNAVNSELAYAWSNGSDAGTLPTSIVLDSAQIVGDTATGSRMPLYRIGVSVRFSKAPSPNFSTVEPGIGGFMFDLPSASSMVHFNYLPVTPGAVVNSGASWNR